MNPELDKAPVVRKCLRCGTPMEQMKWVRLEGRFAHYVDEPKKVVFASEPESSFVYSSGTKPARDIDLLGCHACGYMERVVDTSSLAILKRNKAKSRRTPG